MITRHKHLESQSNHSSMTVFTEDTVFEGELKYNTALTIQGKFKGKIWSKGLLIIDKNAFVEAEIFAETLCIAGTLKGNIYVKDRVELQKNAKLYGDIKAGRLKISDGVLFEGHCEMTG